MVFRGRRYAYFSFVIMESPLDLFLAIAVCTIPILGVGYLIGKWMLSENKEKYKGIARTALVVLVVILFLVLTKAMDGT